MRYLGAFSEKECSIPCVCSGVGVPVARPRSRRREVLGSESGQVLPWAVFLIILFLGMSAFVIDVARAMVVQRKLQVSADAAAMAAAGTMPTAGYLAVGRTYSAADDGLNAYPGISIGTPTVTARCLSSLEDPCSATNPNAVAVTQQATIPTFFAGIFGIKTMTVNARATAARGAKPQPLHISVVVDTTPSMDYTDASCGGKTQMECATEGIQQLLLHLKPSLDTVSLFTFPNIDYNTVSDDTDCSASPNPTVLPYSFPSATATTYGPTSGATYQITGFLTNYLGSDSSTSLNTSSALANAVGIGSTSGGHGHGHHGSRSCTGMKAADSGTAYTYYAGALYAAQGALVAAQRTGTQNVIILLSDGNATARKSDMSAAGQNTSGSYPSYYGECGQGVDAAQAIARLGTKVYTVAYGASTRSSGGNCASDNLGGSHRGISPCQAMQQMASDPSYFYSDYTGPAGDAGCTGSGGTPADMVGIFDDIAYTLSVAHLIPNNTP